MRADVNRIGFVNDDLIFIYKYGLLTKGKTMSRRRYRKMAVRGIQSHSEPELPPFPNTVRKCPPRATTFSNGSMNVMSLKMPWKYGNFQNYLLNI